MSAKQGLASSRSAPAGQVRIGCNNIMCLHGAVVEDAQVRARMAAMAATIHLHWQWQVQNPKGTALICAWGRVMGNT